MRIILWRELGLAAREKTLGASLPPFRLWAYEWILLWVCTFRTPYHLCSYAHPSFSVALRCLLQGLGCMHMVRVAIYSTLNDIIHCYFSAARVPSRLEPLVFCSLMGKRPDLVPWWLGRPLVWDATYPDTFAMSYRCQATTAAGYVPAHAKEKKCGKYSHLAPTYLFQPMVIKSGVIGPNLCHF